MVKIAVAGGTGNVATTLLHPTLTSGLHEITILTRSLPLTRLPGVTYIQVDYSDLPALTALLHGTHTCLSFLVVQTDTHSTAQKNLIHACISAGVRRFAPSEWGIKSGSGVAAYANKDDVAGYLAELAGSGQLRGLEYCLFQPSVFMDYFAHPEPLARGLITWPFFIDMQNRRAMVLDGGDQPLVVTAAGDDARILEMALGDERAWPRVGGLRGCRTTINELVALGQEIRGGEWSIEYVKGEDIVRNELKTSWVPRISHPAVPVEKQEEYSGQFVCEFLTCIMTGKWDVSDEWNQRFPEYKFMSAEEYLRKAWQGRP